MPKNASMGGKRPVLNKENLASFLQTEGGSISAENGEPLDDFARWLINANIKKFSGRIGMSNSEIIQTLHEIKRPGPHRELIKSLLATQLFERVIPESSTEGMANFIAVAKNEGDLRSAKALMAADEAEMGVTANRALLEGIELLGCGEVENAFIKYDEMRRGLLAGEFIGPHTQGALSVRPLSQLSNAVDASLHSKSPRELIQFTIDRHFTEKKPIALIGLDPVYHDRYAERLVNSVNGAFNIHFHLCNPSEVKMIAADNVRYSFENDFAASKPFYATMRFLALRQILQNYEAPIITLDADSFSNGEVPKLFDLLENHDIALHSSSDSRGVLPWRYILAGVVGASPTEAAREFLRSFEAQFDLIMAEDGEVRWYVDQALLTSTLYLTQQREPQTRLLIGRLFRYSGMTQSKI